MNARQRTFVHIPAPFRHLTPYVMPLAVTAVCLIIFLVTVVNLYHTLQQQFDSGEAAQNFQLAEGSNSFVQLQRETLKLLALVNLPIEEVDQVQLRTQIDLLKSRFFQLDLFTTSSTSPRIQAQSARELLDAHSEEVISTLDIWYAAEDPEGVEAPLVDALTELDRAINSAVLEINRARVQSVITFRSITTEAQNAFVIAGAAFVLLMAASLFVLYSYLRQGQRTAAALQAVRFKDEFLAIMSHELRTPLNAIIGFLGVMKMQGANPTKFPHMIDRARVNADRVLSLIDDILDMSKIGAGRFEIHPEPVQLRDLVKRWRTQTDVLAQQKGLEFDCVIDDALPSTIVIDPDALSKIVTNLLSNAVKFTETGSVKMVMQSTGGGSRLVVKVTDTGIGIPAAMQDTIFESFRQVDGSIRRNYGGSGLGLSIVKQLAQLIGGTVTVESEVGSGSTFTVTLPLTVAAAQPAPAIEPATALT